MASKQETANQAVAARPVIGKVEPAAAITGGELHIRGQHMASSGRPGVRFGNRAAHLTVAGDSYIIARVPEGATVGDLVVTTGTLESEIRPTHIGVQIADSLHPVANPAVDQEGNVFSTFSGSRGQKSPVSIYKIDTNYNSKPFVTDLMNPTGLAFDSEENLYVGDRSGTIFKISRSRQIYVFATLEPSIAAYHLAFGPEDYLYVSGPTTSSFDSVYRISKAGEVETFYRGLGRPQGLAFDADGNLYVAASLGGRRGVIRLDSSRHPEQFLSGPGIVGLAFTPSRAMITTTQNAVFRVDVDVAGRRMPWN